MSNRRRKRIIGVIGAGDETMATLKALGVEPKAAPRSGRCMSCGEPLKPTEDHSVCDLCWPASVDPKWKEPNPQGGPDYVSLDLDDGSLREVPDPFDQLEDDE